MQIGELSRTTGVSIRMLRYYEAQGLLRPARSPCGYRRYSVDDVDFVQRIVLLNGAGLNLATIRQLLPCVSPASAGAEPCEALKRSVRHKLVELDRQIAGLTESRRLLRRIARLG